MRSNSSPYLYFTFHALLYARARAHTRNINKNQSLGKSGTFLIWNSFIISVTHRLFISTNYESITEKQLRRYIKKKAFTIPGTNCHKHRLVTLEFMYMLVVQVINDYVPELSKFNKIQIPLKNYIMDKLYVCVITGQKLIHSWQQCWKLMD